MYIELGKFGMPAKHHETIALIYSKVTRAEYGADTESYPYHCCRICRVVTNLQCCIISVLLQITITMTTEMLQGNQLTNTSSGPLYQFFCPRNKCRLEMARIYCSMNQYSEALQIYEELGYSSLESRLIKYSADEYFFRAGLCHLAIDW